MLAHVMLDDGNMPLDRRRDRTWTVTAGAASIVSAFLASACCIGPLLLAAIGLGGGVALARLEAYRPYFVVATFSVLSAGFYFAYRRKPATGIATDACECPAPRSRTTARILLWVATLVAVGFVAFPYVAPTVLG